MKIEVSYFHQVSDFMKKENAEQEKKKQKELELKRGWFSVREYFSVS